jgi:probable phosphoglycerate mutase
MTAYGIDIPAQGDVYLIRHGATTWSKEGRHTGRTDLPLDEDGIKAAMSLETRLAPINFRHVFTSPLQRAYKTCELAGYAAEAVVSDDLLEWDYGDYEGLTKDEIHKTDPGWDVYDRGAKGGESVEEVLMRCRNFLKQIQDLEKPVAIFSHSHFLRSFATVYIDEDIKLAQKIQLDTAKVSVLAKSSLGNVIVSWNA